MKSNSGRPETPAVQRVVAATSNHKEEITLLVDRIGKNIDQIIECLKRSEGLIAMVRSDVKAR